MTTQQLDKKFNLIGDPIVRAVVRHLYEPEFEQNLLEKSNKASRVLSNSFDWSIEVLNLNFWCKLQDELIENPNHSFTPEELQQVQKAYPELFNADGSLKQSDNKDDAEDIGNFALILDEKLRGYVIKYAKLERPDKPLAELVKSESTASGVLGDAFYHGPSMVLPTELLSQEFWCNIYRRLEENPATKLTDEEREVLKNPYHEQNNTEKTPIKVEEPKPELNRNEIAWDILMHLITSPKFDGDKKVVDNAFELADEFIKHSHESNNNK